MTQNLPK